MNKIEADVLREHGISLTEYYILNTVFLEGPLIPEDLLRFSVTLSGNTTHDECPLPAYHQAMDSCIRNQWLQVLSEDECKGNNVPGAIGCSPKLEWFSLIPGAVDFTQKGYLFYRVLVLKMHGSGRVQYNESGWFVNEAKMEVHILAETEEVCQRRINELLGNPALYIADNAKVTNVTGPEIIRQWMPNRFIAIPRGVHAKVRYAIIIPNTINSC